MLIWFVTLLIAQIVLLYTYGTRTVLKADDTQLDVSRCVRCRCSTKVVRGVLDEIMDRDVTYRHGFGSR